MNKGEGVAVLSGELDAHVGQMVTAFTQDFPDWIRVVIWVGRLMDGSEPTDTTIRLNRVLSYRGGGVVADYYTGLGTAPMYRRIDELTQDVDWTQCRIVADRNGARQVQLVKDEPRRQVEGSATDPYWHQVDDYLELNRKEVDALVERLRASGDLPGEKKPRRGILGLLSGGA